MQNMTKRPSHWIFSIYDSVLRRKPQNFKVNTLRWQSNQNRGSEKPTSDEEDGLKKLKELLDNPPTTCCMSGCSNCVWIQYAEELGKLSKESGDAVRQTIEKNVTDPSLKAFLLTEIRMRNL